MTDTIVGPFRLKLETLKDGEWITVEVHAASYNDALVRLHQDAETLGIVPFDARPRIDVES